MGNEIYPGKTALLLGATGLIGSFCLNKLLEDENYARVICLLRKRINKSHSKLIQHIINFDELQAYDSQIIGDDIYCCLGTTIKQAGSKQAFEKVDLEYPLEIARIALKNGAEKFLLISSLGANKNSSVFYNRTKGKIEEALSSLNYNNLIIFRPSLLIGSRSKIRTGEIIGKFLLRFLSFMLIGRLKKYRAIHAKTVAVAMIKAAHQNLTGNVIFESDKIAALGSNLNTIMES